MLKERDPYFDSARAILIVLVVIGHLLAQVGSESTDIVVRWIYTFHMPAFIAVTGFLSRNYTGSPRQVGRLLTGVLVPYVIFQVLQAAGRVIVDDAHFDVHLTVPGWTLWFLLALFIWRLLTPILRAMWPPVVLVAATLVSLISPMDSDLDQELSLARVLGFLPFFVLGLVTTPERLARLRAWLRPWHGYLALVILLGLTVTFWDRFPLSYLYLSSSYENIGLTRVTGLVMRLFVLVGGLLGTLAVLAITPTGKHWWTVLGRNSLTIYLLHPLVLLPWRYGDLADTMTSPMQAALLIAVSVLLSVLLGLPITARLTRFLTNPPIERWLVRDDGGRDRSAPEKA